MVALDMSFAFDTVNHNKLIRVLKEDFGFKDRVGAWLES